jgi:hypothetical protein
MTPGRGHFHGCKRLLGNHPEAEVRVNKPNWPARLGNPTDTGRPTKPVLPTDDKRDKPT